MGERLHDKAVIMDEYAGLGKGWNDPDMLVIGMNGIDMTMCLSHMAMWCMMNSPLMLGLDLRRVNKGDDIYNIISNKELIALDQDPLGVQAKRIFSTAGSSEPDKEYIRDNKRIDILAKPLANGDIALGFFNLDQVIRDDDISTDIDTILKALDNKAVSTDALKKAASFMVKDLITGVVYETPERTFNSGTLAACGCKVIRISPVT